MPQAEKNSRTFGRPATVVSALIGSQSHIAGREKCVHFGCDAGAGLGLGGDGWFAVRGQQEGPCRLGLVDGRFLHLMVGMSHDSGNHCALRAACATHALCGEGGA